MDDYALLLTWRAVGAKYGVSAGAVYRLAMQGKEPRKMEIRARLGLPALAPAPVCPVHGVVHARLCHAAPAWVTTAADWLAAREKERHP